MDEAVAWPLAGRDVELCAIEETLTSNTAGVVLVGEQGVGKTRLMREALSRWVGQGHPGEWVSANGAAAAIPFGAISHLLPTGVLLDGDPLALFERVAEHVAARSGPDRMAVAVDDAHLLDEASATVLHQLVVRELALPLATLRSGEPVSDAVLALWKDTEARRLTVKPLGAAAVNQLLDHALQGQIDPVSRQRISRLAGGNPLLLGELLADALETGALVRREGVWCWDGPVPSSARVAELVASRLHTLDPAAREVLETIACGEPLSLSLAERLAGPAAIEAAERSGMAVAVRSGARVALRLAHPLYGQVLRASMPASRARTIWAALAAALAEGPLRRRDDELTVGVWQLESGVIDSPHLQLTAARQAMARFDLSLAERLARAARTDGGWDADWLLAQILTSRGRVREAEAVLPGAPHAADARQAMWAVTRAGIVYWGLGRVDEAERVLAAAESGRDLTESTRAWILLYDGRCRVALDVAETVLAMPDANDQAFIWAANVGITAAGILGQLDRAERIAERGGVVARMCVEQIPWGEPEIGYGLCLALCLNGHLRRAQEVADDGHRSAVARDAGPMVGFWSAHRGIVAKGQGRIADAQAALREAVALIEQNDTYRIVRAYLAELAGAAALAGDLDTARDCMVRVDALKHGSNRLFDAWIELNRAWVEAAGGALSAGADLALQAAKLAHDSEQPTIEAICLYDAARLGAARSVHERLSTLDGRLGTPFAATMATAAYALAAADPVGLERAAAEFADHGHLLLAAEANTAAARAYQRTGEGQRARLALERAVPMAAACQGARTPLVDLGGVSDALTLREREVALMATTLQSSQIAERLGLSVRTINNTLARVYAKLGVSNRSQLATILHTARP